MKHSTSQIQKKVIIIIALALASIVAKAQSQNDADYTSIALAETEEEESVVELETTAVNISSTAASEKIMELTNSYIMENNNRKPMPGKVNTKSSETAPVNSSTVIQEMVDADFLMILKKAMEETKRAKIENTCLRLTQK